MTGAAASALLGLAACRGGGEPKPLPSVRPSPPAPAATQPPVLSPVPGYLDPARWTGRTLTVASQGGDYQQAQTEAFFDPFALATGALVRQEPADPDELRGQVEQGPVTWDLVDLPADRALALARDNLLTSIDYLIVDRAALAPEVVLQHGVGTAIFSTTIGYAAAAERAPAGWPDFWDIARLPGPRALRRAPAGTFEFALLADGVPLAELYPIDVERAFASLERIKPHVAQWYDNALQPVELLLNGSVAMASTFNVLAAGADAAGAVGLQWRGGMLSAQVWVVPLGAPNADVAMDLINFATRAVPSANFVRLIPFGPVNRDAFDLLRPDRLALLPNAPAHRPSQFVQNWNYWLDHETALRQRFERWLLLDPALPGATTPSPP